MSKVNEITIYGHSIKPGQKKTIHIPMPKLYDCTPLSLPVHIINGKLPGPTLCITAAVHGDEINGTEIIRRMLKKKTINKLRGTLIAIPIVNIYGFIYQERYLMDRRDLNRSFPGTKKGSIASRLAYMLTSEILSKSSHIIDLHTGSNHRSNLPQIRANLDVNEVHELALAFNVPVILHASLRDGSMRQYANELNIPFLLYEAGEALRFDELSIRSGVNGILGVMTALDMLTMKPQKIKQLTPEIARSSYWVRAPISGICRPKKKLGMKVKQGELLAIIANPTSSDEYKLKSPITGIVIGQYNLPLIHAGAALFHIATFEQLHLVEEQVEFLQEAHSVEEL